MDIDERADAGPSNPKINGFHSEQQDDEEWPLLYPVPIEGIPSAGLSGSQDLISLFELSNTYDTFVRPYLSASKQQEVAAALAGNDTKGKGKAVDGQAVDAAVGGQGKDRARAMKKHYSHVIADVPGQHKLAKDRHIQDLLLNPDPPDQLKLLPFDSNALRDAFSLEVGTLPDFDTSIWKADAGEERKKKKKRRQDDNTANGVPSAAPSPAAAAPGLGKRRRMEQ